MKAYNHKQIEKKWQRAWAKSRLYSTPDNIKGKDNFYLLVEFPYPSGNLHVGHWYAFAVPDILARHLRMKGKNVLYPIGFDAFGLPAENAAIKNKLNPRKWTEKNIAYMIKQIESMGTSFDWSRSVSTIDPSYYKWTQWLFLQLFRANLAYQKETAVNWCPKDKTVLANEQVIDGKCERCDSPVEQRQMLQWNLKITDYADRLVDDLEPLDWPEEIKESQRNWIGRSEGVEIDFPLVFDDDKKYKYVILHGFQSSPDSPRWQWLKTELEQMGHEVVVPALPNPDNPVEEEQVAAALAATNYDENTVLVGHSLGGVVAMKVAERLNEPVARLVLVGGFADPHFKDKPRNFEKTFIWTFDSEKMRKNAKVIQILHDPRDYAISNEQLGRLETLLGVKAVLGRSNEPHFTGNTEPDVLMWLRPTIRVFTTRPDTIFGATYLVLAPEHPWVTLALGHKTVLKNNDEVQAYVDGANKKTELERQENKEKTGVELKGVKAANPATGERIPLWVADFVIGAYGTGAVFADAHDERDWAFAKKYGIPLKETLKPLVIRTTGSDVFRTNAPAVDRHTVLAIVRHWKDDSYLCLSLKKRDMKGFIGGGIEEGEDAVAAGLREIREETGYKNARLVRNLGTTIHSYFYHPERDRNTKGHFKPLLFSLNDETREEISEEENALHDIVWLKRGEVGDFINRDDMKIAWSRVAGDVCYAGKGILFDSGEFNGLTSDEAIPKMGAKFGRLVKQYRLRDWIVSRQRYWGVPIPIVHCEKCGPVAVPDDQLPVLLPDVKDYLPTGDGKSPLAKVRSFVHTTCPKCGGKAERETDTLDTFVDSSWYFLRYSDPKNDKEFAAKNKQDNWMPVDLYSGGPEHTTMHVLYSRFWHKALYDMRLVTDSEPYKRRMNHGIVLGPDNQKMSKSRGNVVDPDGIVARLGADTVRLYLAFVGPYNEVGSYPWNPDGVVGVRRFLERVWRLQESVVDSEVPTLQPLLHRAIKKIGDDIQLLKFNTAIAQLMMFLNAAEKQKAMGKRQWLAFLRLLAPFAPHMAEELWQVAGSDTSVHASEWPAFDPRLLVDEEVTIAIQIDGKTRGEIKIARDSDRATVERVARDAVAKRLEGKTVTKTIIVPNRLANFVLIP